MLINVNTAGVKQVSHGTYVHFMAELTPCYKRGCENDLGTDEEF